MSIFSTANARALVTRIDAKRIVLGNMTLAKRNADFDEDRARALLTAAYGRALPAASVAHLRGAIRSADKAYAATHLALMGLPTLVDPAAAERRMLQAETLLTMGVMAKAIIDAQVEADRPLNQTYDPDQPRVPMHSPGGGRWTADGMQVASNSTVIPGPSIDAKHADQMRSWIALIAGSYVDSQKWITDGILGPYGRGKNKCNIFVDSVLTQAGIAPPRLNHGPGFSHPPTAGQWANSKIAIPGWRVLGPDEIPQSGDIVAQRIGYDDATGHVMFVGPDDTFVGTGGHGNGPEGTIERIPKQDSLASDPTADAGPLVYRRWVGR